MSFILYRILKKRIPEWNEKVFTEGDFERLCEAELVRVIETDVLRSKGEYISQHGFAFILIRQGLPKIQKLWVGLHELGHHLMHYPVPHRFSKGIVRRMDREANYFAAIALMPTQMILQTSFSEIAEETGYSKELLLIRKEIYDAYKI